MRFPVEVVAQRPEEIVEVGDLVPQIVGDRHRLLQHIGLLLLSRSALLLQRQLLTQHVDLIVDVGRLLEQIGRAGFGIGLGELLVHALLAHDVGNRTAFDRRAQWPGDGLHPGDAREVEHALGDPVHDEHVRRVAQVVVGNQHQDLGVEPCLRKMFGGNLIATLASTSAGRYFLSS